MSITLTYNVTTADLGDRLIWSDEFAWSPVAQVTEPGTTGALLVHVGVRSAGRPITLDGNESRSWMTRNLVASLQESHLKFEDLLRSGDRAKIKAIRRILTLTHARRN